MSDEPVMEQDEAEFRQTLLEVVHSHKLSIDAVAEDLRSQKVLVGELFAQAYAENGRRNELTTAVNELDANFAKLEERLGHLEDKILALEYKPVSSVC
jgi:hypothetical protein